MDVTCRDWFTKKRNPTAFNDGHFQATHLPTVLKAEPISRFSAPGVFNTLCYETYRVEETQGVLGHVLDDLVAADRGNAEQIYFVREGGYEEGKGVVTAGVTVQPHVAFLLARDIHVCFQTN